MRLSALIVGGVRPRIVSTAFWAVGIAALCACSRDAPPQASSASPLLRIGQAPAPDAADGIKIAPPPVDYAAADSWLCRPGRNDACAAADLRAVEIAADGARTVRAAGPAADSPIDCFYVYPAVSRDASGNSDLHAGPEETAIVQAEFARFASVCRTYAPLYRQVTATALEAALRGRPMETDRDQAYEDVEAAWRRYLEVDNAGRPFVLIGHGQGAGILARLIANEIEGRPEASRLLSAILPGGGVFVRAGAPTGGSFKQLPLCSSSEQLGCVIAWSAFKGAPPPGSVFGRAATVGMSEACVNPAALAHPEATEERLTPFLSARPAAPFVRAPDLSGVADAGSSAAAAAPFIALPGRIAAACAAEGGATWLDIRVDAQPEDVRAGDIGGELVLDGQALPAFGLDPIALELAMGDLIAIVRTEGKAWSAAHAQAERSPPGHTVKR